MAKIVIGKKTQYTNYFDLAYTFTLDIPVLQIGKENQDTTKDISGEISYDNTTPIETIQADLIKRFNIEQNNLNTNNRLSFYGLTWNGSIWS